MDKKIEDQNQHSEDRTNNRKKNEEGKAYQKTRILIYSSSNIDRLELGIQIDRKLQEKNKQ